MDVSQILKKKSDDLIQCAEVLRFLKINWEKPISIKLNELYSRKDLDVSTKIFESYKKRPGVYYFKIISHHKGQEIVNALSNYKNLKERSCPKIHKRGNLDSKFLYCGSRKEGLHGRLIQHLGYGSKNTFALQLIHWAKRIDLELEFHYAWLDENNKRFTELIESAIANEISPLVGKMT